MNRNSVNTVYSFSANIRMVFGVRKCWMLVLKRGKIKCMDELTIPSKELMKQLENTSYKFLGIFEMANLMEKEMKAKLKV